MEYPEEIYENRQGHLMTKKQIRLSGWAREKAYELGHDAGYWKGYEAGKSEQSDPLTHYSNLTSAIKDNEPIDWERLDGLNVKCVNPGLMGELHGTLKRDPNCSIERAVGWWNGDVDRVYTSALRYAWDGDNGWTLYVEGEIPLRRKTADQLKVGTYFLGQLKGESPYLAYVGRPLATDTEKTIYYAPEMLKAIATATDWVVLEEYGPFQKPEGK